MATRPTLKCHFVPGLPSESPEIPTVRTLVILEAYNFMCRPSMEMRSEEIVAFIKRFPTICCMPPAHKEIGAIFDF